MSRAFWLASFLLSSGVSTGATLHVGPAQTFRSPCAAFAAAHPGDLIEIESAGQYSGDVCAITQPNLTIRGIGPARPHIRAGGKARDAKAIWVIYQSAANTVIENLEFSGARVPDKNGAAIRVDPGIGVTIRNCYIHDNETGILTAPAPNADVVIEYSTFENNGAGDGYSHNLYVHRARRLIFRGNYSRRANIGQLLKTRARENWIVANRLTQEDGTGSREIDIAEGGLTYILGNLIQQGPQTSHRSMIGFAPEGPNPDYPSHQLQVINNTFVNQAPTAEFVQVHRDVRQQAIIANNIFYGTGVMCTQPHAVLSHNLMSNPLFVDLPTLDLHLRPGSSAINAGDTQVNVPDLVYRHPACLESRLRVGQVDIGAYEFGARPGLPVNVGPLPTRCQ